MPLNALQMLQGYLNGQLPPRLQSLPPRVGMSPDEMAWLARATPQVPQQSLPPGLPGAVTRSIQQQPSYAEGQTLPSGPVPWQDYESFAPEARLFLTDPNQRERLANEVWAQRTFPSAGIPLQEGQVRRLNPDSPYNTNLGFPFAMY